MDLAGARVAAAVALVVLLAGTAHAQAPSTSIAPPEGTSASPCDVSAAPAKCRACVRQAKATAARGDNRQMVAPLCGVCASLPTPALQDYCATCIAKHGASAGCAMCASKAISNVMARARKVQWVAPLAQDLKEAVGCLECSRAAAPDVQAGPACYACWIPPTVGMRDACSACVAAAPSARDAGVCAICSSEGIYATERQCYDCQRRAKNWMAKGLCGLSPRPDQTKKKGAAGAAAGTAPLLQEYFSCLAAARGDAGAQLCTLCLPATSGLGEKRGRECFACLQGQSNAGLSEHKMMEQGYGCVRP